MKTLKLIIIVLVSVLIYTGCALLPSEGNNRPEKNAPLSELPVGEDTMKPDGEGVLHFTVMVHLEGWDDGSSQIKFEKHAEFVREYAALFEKYGAILTLESKEFTTGCIVWNDNVLKEMETRGHGIGLHADEGGDRKQTFKEFNDNIAEMKQELESLDVTVRHVSGVCSDKDWVKVCVDNDFEAVTGVVSYSLWSLDEDLRPEGFEPYRNPGEGHSAYPWDTQLTILPWRTSSGSNWIYPEENGKLLIIPAGLGMTAAYEAVNGHIKGGAGFEFDVKDIQAWQQRLDELLTYTDSDTVNTYYAAWSLGATVDTEMLEAWLQMIDEYVQEGRIVWMNISDMIDLYNEGSK